MKILFLTLGFICSSIIYLNAQIPPIAKAYHKALKKQSIAPLSPYFRTSEQLAEMLSWSTDSKSIAKLDSFHQIYIDSLDLHLQKLYLSLKKKNFDLKKSKLLKAERSLGISADLRLHLQYDKKAIDIYVCVIDFKEQDYLSDIYPSEQRYKSSYRAFREIRGVQYDLWDLRDSEIKKAIEIINKIKYLEVDGESYSLQKTPFVLMKGLETKDGKRYAQTNAVKTTDFFSRKTVLIDLENEEIIELKAPQSSNTIISQLSKDEKLAEIQKKSSKEQFNKLRLIQTKKQDLDLFIDSLKQELIDQSGGYMEIDGRKVLKDKKNKEAPEKIFLTEGKGKELKLKMIELRSQMIALFEDQKSRDFLDENLKLNPDVEGAKKTGRTWEEQTFKQMPIIAVLHILGYFKNNIKVSEDQIIDELLQNE